MRKVRASPLWLHKRSTKPRAPAPPTRRPNVSRFFPLPKPTELEVRRTSWKLPTARTQHLLSRSQLT